MIDPPLVYMDNSFDEFDDFALAAHWGAENLPALLDISNSTNVSAWSGEEQQVMQGILILVIYMIFNIT